MNKFQEIVFDKVYKTCRTELIARKRENDEEYNSLIDERIVELEQIKKSRDLNKLNDFVRNRFIV